MCFKVLCRRCGKYTWGGCGNHLSNVYNSIEEGNHCMCRSWPGLVIPRPTQEPTKSSTTPPQGITMLFDCWRYAGKFFNSMFGYAFGGRGERVALKQAS
ncbi:hypothetical protein JHK82_045067 [Glycine max]|uniref:Uncharacterized protein n=3 Tax=Glycine subgen. Soja TaxID=1462606 RepID=A0A0R0FR26_SOYBN|nr:hypothetical protein JHK86_045482 [Glycine max]KAG4941393.1 hypothetical protein JHK87_045264 [Glycine soja]KAG4952195.1 hypothetical protein JHK85_046062 [Glycine max]KAG5100015.1 hypothetical protein JHK82_045067 [Glycine max]KAG5108616.1 hypothetical protein JHK84_045523 [Glycine max]